jgi:hypothetical protein
MSRPTAGDDGWEQRMADSTATRRAAALPDQHQGGYTAWRRDHDMTPTMTLADAMRWLRSEPFGCACVGPPWCCMDVQRQSVRLQRVAHIAVKAFAELAERRATRTETIR